VSVIHHAAASAAPATSFGLADVHTPVGTTAYSSSSSSSSLSPVRAFGGGEEGGGGGGGGGHREATEAALTGKAACGLGLADGAILDLADTDGGGGGENSCAGESGGDGIGTCSTVALTAAAFALGRRYSRADAGRCTWGRELDGGRADSGRDGAVIRGESALESSERSAEDDGSVAARQRLDEPAMGREAASLTMYAARALRGADPGLGGTLPGHAGGAAEVGRVGRVGISSGAPVGWWTFIRIRQPLQKKSSSQRPPRASYPIGATLTVVGVR
jgi:hypothetical protein